MLLGVDDRDDDPLVCDVERAQKLLWTAGMHVTTLSCSSTGKTCPGLFRELDRWLMQSVEQPELVCCKRRGVQVFNPSVASTRSIKPVNYGP